MRSLLRFLCLFSIMIFVLSALISPSARSRSVRAAEAPMITKADQNATTVRKFEKFELTIDIKASYDNPFRMETNSENFLDDLQTPTGSGINLQATVTSPSGRQVIVPGYWDVDYIHYPGSDIYAANSSVHWHIRYSPQETGTYKYFLALTDKNGQTRYPESGTKQFYVEDSTNRGFLRTSKDTSGKPNGYLEFDNGQAFTEFGMMTPGSGYQYVDNIFPKLAENGGNLVRQWLTNNAPQDIFRPGLIKWSDSTKYDSTVAKSGRRSAKIVNASAGSTAIDQSFVGAKPNTWYKAKIYVKTDSSFNGAIAARVKDDSSPSKEWKSSSPVSGPNKNWASSEIIFQTPSTTKQLHFKPVFTSSATAGQAWIDDVELYEVADQNGTSKYDFNQVWNPSFEKFSAAQLYYPNIWKFDYLVTQAEKYGIQVDAPIFDYRVFANGPTDYGDYYGYWSDYFGYRDKTESFWTGPRSIKQAKEVVRNLIARFSYSTALGMWELTNEMPQNYAETKYSWIKTMSEYLHNIDPVQHLVTNSYWGSPGAYQYEQLDTMDVSSVHYYINDETRKESGCNFGHWDATKDEYWWGINRTVDTEAKLKTNQPDHQQPWISGEFGLMGDFLGSDGKWKCADLSRWASPSTPISSIFPRRDTTGIFFHNGMWSILLANGFKSSVTNWWYDPFNTWNYYTHFKAGSTFAKNLPFHDASATVLAAGTDFTSIKDKYNEINLNTSQVQSTNTNIRALGRQKDNQAYLWIQNKNNTWYNRISQNQSINDETGTITIPGFTAGSYTLSIYDTYTGDITSTTEVSADSTGQIKLTASLTKAKPDIAVIVTKKTVSNPITITQSTQISDGGTAAHNGDGIIFSINVKNNTSLKQTANIKDTISSQYLTDISVTPEATISNDTAAYKATITWPAFVLEANQRTVLTIKAKVNKPGTPPPFTSSLITNLTISSGKQYQVAKLAVENGAYYIDRDYVLKTLPEALTADDVEWIRTANGDKQSTGDSFIKFSLAQDSTIYIARNPNTPDPEWLKTWEATSLSIQTSHLMTNASSLKVFKKVFAKGEVSLGGNYGNSNSDMYLVAIKPGAIKNLRVEPTNDAYVTPEQPTQNFGANTYLRADGQPNINSYLQFDLSKITKPVVKATLYLTVGDNGSVDGGTVKKISRNDWTEKTITNNNQPPHSDAIALSSLGKVDAKKQYTLDLKNAINQAGIYSFYLTSNNSDGVNFYSKETVDIAKRPYIILEFAD